MFYMPRVTWRVAIEVPRKSGDFAVWSGFCADGFESGEKFL
jgi:hypothetical protein